jgi:type IV pilus assembly protein PilE
MAGMTLIELLVAMVIVALLAAIAVPSYQRQVMRSNRAAARACLNEHAQFMERFYTSNLTYEVDAPPVLGCETDGNLDVSYVFEFSADPTQRTYSVQARPIGAQLTRDTQCATLTLNQTGLPGETGTGTVADCW